MYFKFRVIVGRHHESGKTYYKDGPYGDTLVTQNDLRKHNFPQAKKFQFLGPVPDSEAKDFVKKLEEKFAKTTADLEAKRMAAIENMEESEAEDYDESLDFSSTYDTMSDDELRSLAEENGIDLGKATKRETIIAKIEQFMGVE